MSDESQLPAWVKEIIIPAVTGVSAWLASAFAWGRKLGRMEMQIASLEATGVSKAKYDVLDAHYVECKTKLVELTNKVEQIQRDSRVDLGQYATEEAFREAMKQQEEQWQQINRTLGQIEGYLAALQPMNQRPQTLHLPSRPKR